MLITVLPTYGWFQPGWAICTCVTVYHPLIAIQIRALAGDRHISLYQSGNGDICSRDQAGAGGMEHGILAHDRTSEVVKSEMVR